jgi:hypothetical protein
MILSNARLCSTRSYPAARAPWHSPGSTASTTRPSSHGCASAESGEHPRHGVELPRHTLCRWADITADTLEPLYKRTREKLLAKDVLQADESPVRYLDPGRGKCATGYYWGLHAPQCGDKGGILFQWHPSRRAACLDDLLPGYIGILQTDGYAAYDSWASKNPGITLAACWAHARRKFHEALKTGHTLAAAPLRHIQRHIQRLNLYAADGRVEIDNNHLENSFRPPAVGKRNWLFVGGEATGRRGAILHTLLENAVRHGHNPEAWLADVLQRLPAMTNHDDLEILLPSNWLNPGTATPTLATCA